MVDNFEKNKAPKKGSSGKDKLAVTDFIVPASIRYA
jgi:hypothetical protein